MCDRAREHGLLVTLEYLPWSGIPDATTALAIVERSGRANATLMFDTWHTFRGPTDEAQLREDPRRADRQRADQRRAGRAARQIWCAETLSARLLPGEGAIPLVRWLRSLDAIGSTRADRRRGVLERARRAAARRGGAALRRRGARGAGCGPRSTTTVVTSLGYASLRASLA